MNKNIKESLYFVLFFILFVIGEIFIGMDNEFFYLLADIFWIIGLMGMGVIIGIYVCNLANINIQMDKKLE